jgi:hypothetical protein
MRASMSPSVIRLATISSTNRYRSMYLMIAGAEAWAGYSLSRNNLERLSPSGGCNNSSRGSFSSHGNSLVTRSKISCWAPVATEATRRSIVECTGSTTRQARSWSTARRSRLSAGALRRPAQRGKNFLFLLAGIKLHNRRKAIHPLLRESGVPGHNSARPSRSRQGRSEHCLSASTRSA